LAPVEGRPDADEALIADALVVGGRRRRRSRWLRTTLRRDGEKLVDMLEKLELGLKPVKTFKIDDTFFDQFRTDTPK